MFAKLTMNQRFLKAQREIELAKAAQEKLAADLDYIAMMCDVELESEENAYDEA